MRKIFKIEVYDKKTGHHLPYQGRNGLKKGDAKRIAIQMSGEKGNGGKQFRVEEELN